MGAVRIVAETGELTLLDLAWFDNAGAVVHPALLTGQLLGGLAQGLDMPAVRLASHNTPSAAKALGAEGVGEAGCIGVPAALLNAVDDALAPLGRRASDFPLTAERLWRVLQG